MNLRVTFGVLLGLIGLYALMGVFQAVSLFTGARALSNFNFWASVSFLSYAASLAVLIRPWRFIPRITDGYIAAVAALLVIAGVLLIQPFVVEFFAADACSSSGGSFDYVSSACDRSTDHPFIGLGWRSGFRLLLSFICATGAVTFAWLSVRRVRANNSFKPKPLRGSA